jgi:uncharacterized damage-inducible protein DinB/rhodanese-related sulfurtransferase
MKKTAKSLVDEAMAQVTTYSVEQARALHGHPGVQFVDVRDVRELEREGVIPGALHAPRGLLEFWVDPESPYHHEAFVHDKEYVLFCAAGWRSALATKALMDMGLERVAHVGGGFTAWKDAGAPVAAKPAKPARPPARGGGADAMTLAGQLRIQAHANRLANRRLHAAMAPLSDADLHAPRTSFFPSLAATLNHILAVDTYYVGALLGEPGLPAKYDAFEPAATMADLARRQHLSDERLIAYCDALTDAGCDAAVAMDRGDHVQHDRAGHVLAHLFMHQTHHRGQVHAMLAGTAVKPPQLDEFLMPSDAKFRGADMAALGWSEARVYGAR